MKNVQTVATSVAAVTIAASLAAVGVAVAPANASTFPTTDAMYVIGCGDWEEGSYFYNDGTTPLNTIQLFSVDPSTGEATPIGDGTGSNDVSDVDYSEACESEPAWNPVTQTAYFGGYVYDVDTDTSREVLMTMDLTTGEATEVAEFNGFTGAPSGCSSSNSFQSMAIGDDGAAYFFDTNACLFSLDLATATTTYIGGEANADAGRYYAQAWSFDPVSSMWQVLEEYDEFLSTVNVGDGILSASGPSVAFNVDYSPQSLEFDSTGLGWVINDEYDRDANQSHSVLYTIDVATGATTEVSDTFTAANGEFYATSLLITRPAAPTLPDTGISSTVAWSLGSSAAVLLAGGIVLTLLRRRQG
jgi:LPXTG-motif cell wall-anchored protein